MKRFLPIHKGVIALLLALFAGMGTAYAYQFQQVYNGKTFYFNIIDATNHYVEITYPGTSTSNPWGGYTKPTGNISLPSTVTYNGTTYTVKRIGNYAFYTCSGLTGSLSISGSTNTIGNYAFYNCTGFTSLSLGNSVTTIGNYAFQGCTGITGTLTIPSSVTSIGTSSFKNCTNLTKVRYYAVNCADVSVSPFEGCGGTLVIGYGVQRIPAYMFYQCSGFTDYLEISNTVTTIGNYAFYNCTGFTSLILGGSLTSIGNYAFQGCSGFTGSLTIPSSVTSIGYGSFKTCTGFTEVNFYAINCADITSSFQPFQGCGGTLSISLSTQRIPAYIFYNCSGFTGSLTIPNSVTSIGEGAFRNCTGFTGSLSIPNSVASIGNYAFYNCSGFTGSLTIGNSVTSIGYGAFNSCSGFSGSLNLGSSVATIYDGAFMNCSGFSGNLTIPNSVTTIGNGAFSGCSGFTGSLTIGNSVTTIDMYAFENCTGFTGSLSIGNSVTTIGKYAFYNCNGFTGALTIPSCVTSIGNGAFKNDSGFTQIHYNALNCSVVDYDGKPFDGCVGQLFIGSNVQNIPDYMFYSADFTGPLTIPNAVTSIGDYAFAYCSGFTGSLTIPNVVTSIGDYAFAYCSGFTGSLTIPNSVTSIGEGAFRNCTGFTGNLTLGSSLNTIGSYAFNSCNNLSSITTYAETPPSLGNYVFYPVYQTIPLIVPCGTGSAYQNASGWNAFANIRDACELLTYSINPDGVSVTVTGHVDGTAATGPLVIPETKTINGVTYAVTAIGNNAFYGCSGLTGSLILPNSVTTIGNNAFRNCSGLTGNLTIPNSVTTIGNNAFYQCSGFTDSLSIGNSVTTIGTSAFYGCSGFTGSLTISNSVTEIGSSAFSGCSGFTGSLTIGNSVTTIGTYAFDNCSGLTGDLTIPNSVTSLGNCAFQGCSGFTGNLTIGNSLTTIGMNTFYNCSGLTGDLIIPNSVTTIGYTAFYHCYGLTGSLTIGNSVTTIGNGAFNGCSGFTGSLTIPNSVTTIGDWAFYSCSCLSSIAVYAETPPTLGNYVFSQVPKTIPFYVPCASLADYQAATGWNEFTNMMCVNKVTVRAFPIQGGTVSGGGYYVNGNTCTVSASPYSYYQFINWSINGEVVSCTAFYSFTVDEDVELEAVFMPLWYATVIGDYDDTHDYLPSFSYFKYTLSQQIYTADELGGSRTINSISFFNTGDQKTRKYDIYLKHTTKTSFNSIADWITVAQSDKVFSGYVTMKRGTWTTIVFDTPFAYNNSYNLAVIVDDNSGEYTDEPHMSCRVYETENVQAIVSFSDDYNYNPMSPSTFNTGEDIFLYYMKNQIILDRPMYDIDVVCDNPAFGTVSGGGQYGYGDLCRVKATANPGYTFIAWRDEYGTIVSMDAEYEFIVLEDRELEPYYISDDDDVCWITFKLYDSYDDWDYNNLEVCMENGICLRLTLKNSSFTTYTLPFEEGSYVDFYWHDGNYPEECSFTISYPNGNVIAFGDHLDWSYWGDFYVDCAEQPSSYVYAGDHSDATNDYLPSHSNYSGLSEQIYTANEIGTAGTINGIAIYNDGAEARGDYKIYLKTTQKTEFSNSTDWISVTEDDLVYSNYIISYSNYVALHSEWIYFPFITPFEYDGTSNLVLVVDNNRGYVSNDPHISCLVYDAQGNQTLRITGSGTDYDPTNPSSYNGTLMNVKNQLLIDITPAMVTQTIALSSGWNWISTYIEMEDPIEMLQAVEAGLGENGIQIKNSRINTEYDEEWGWFGDLDEEGMMNEEMYKIFVIAPCTVTVEGTPANPANHPITINQGWNWIGFPSGVAISLEDAFAGFAIEGDKIKSRETQIEYDPEWGWFGDFETLEPGQGYMYYSASSTPRTLLFPEGAK